MTEEQKRAKEYEETLERFKSYQELKKKKNKPVVYDTTIKKYKKRKIKLVKKNPFLFILSKRYRLEEYKRNIEVYGYPLSSVPVKYRIPKICESSAKSNPSAFDINYVPLRFRTYDFCTYCVENGVNINKLPEEMIDLELCKLSLEHKGSLSNIPKYMITLALCKYAIEINPNNVKYVPFGPNYVSEDNKKELYMLAWEHGLNFLEMPKEFITREMYEEKVRENPRNIFLFPADMQDVRMWRIALESGLPSDFIFNIPEERRYIELWRLASEYGLDLSQIPERYRKYYVSEDTLTNNIRNDYHNIKKIPEDRLSTELYVEAINSGMPFSDLPEEYRNKETCLAYANKNKKIDSETPKELLDESFYDALVNFEETLINSIKTDYRIIYTVPENRLNTELYVEAINSGMPFSDIPEKHRNKEIYLAYANKNKKIDSKTPKELLDESFCDALVNFEETLINSIKNDYKIIRNIPKSRLNIRLYYEALDSGMPFFDLPKEYMNKACFLTYANTYKKIPRGIPDILLDESFYDALVKLDADNLSLVPFDAEKNVCLRTKEMCKEYVRQKHTINLKLFPLRYLKPAFIKSIFYDAANLSDILDGYIDGMHDYYKLKSLTSSEQVGKYKELLEKFYQKKLLDNSLRIPGATDEEMSKVENSESFKMIKDLNVDKLFCENDEISKEDLIKKIIMDAGKIINKESPRIKYVNNKSSDEDLRKIANAYKEMFFQISGKDIDKSKKDILTKDVRLAIDDLLSELDAHRRDVFNSELGNYKDDDHEHKKSL